MNANVDYRVLLITRDMLAEKAQEIEDRLGPTLADMDTVFTAVTDVVDSIDDLIEMHYSAVFRADA